MATFTWVPDWDCTVDTTPRVKRVQFGDGYMARQADGINNLPRKWSLQFQSSPTECDAIEAFLIARNGVESFDWTPPLGAAGKWITSEEGWKRQKTKTSDIISVVFEEVYE